MKRETGERLLAALLLLALVILLVPMLMIARYDMPQLDDITYGEDAVAALQAGGGARGAFQAALALSGEMYRIWQGTYTATFLMALQPGVWGLAYYGLAVYILLFSLLIGLWALCRTIGRHVLGLNRAERLIAFSLLAILCTQLLPAPVQAFYWFNGAIFYTFFFALALVFFALLIAFAYRTKGEKRNVAYYILLPLLAAALAGGNYATCLQTAMLLAAFVVWRLVKKDKNPLPLAVLAVFLAFFFVSLLSPANAQHQSEAGGLLTALRAGVKAVGKAVCAAVDWLTLPALVGAAALIPAARRFAARTEARFRLPLLVSAASLLLLAAGFVPTLYTQDYTGSDRLLDIQYDLCVLLLFVNVFYWTGWLCRALPGRGEEAPRLKHRTLAVAWLIATALAFMGSYDRLTSFEAAKSLLSGEAGGYQAEVYARQALLEDDAVKDVVFAPLENRPKLLLIYDYSESPEAWENIVVGNVYKKDSLRVSSGE